MFANESAIYGLKYQSRCVAAVSSETEKHQFVVGSLSLRDENEVHFIEFDEYANQIVCKAVYRHSNELWSLSPSPAHGRRFFAVHNDGSVLSATLWQRPPFVETDEKAEELQPLEELLTLPVHADGLHSVLWRPEDETQIASVDQQAVRLWHLDNGGSAIAEGKESATEPVADGAINAASWDPHHTHQFATVNGSGLKCWDLKTMKPTHKHDNAHTGAARDVDYNPNKPYHLVTGGEDRLVKFWDVRRPSEPLDVVHPVGPPLKVLSKHTHWVTAVRFNRFHDQLVLSAGTDSSVNLWSTVSISSAPLGDLEDPANEREGDKLIKTYDEHEDSVYGLAWSACDAWIFASLSYDGRVVINHVPAAEKYKILL